METKTLGILGAISSLVVLPGMAVGAAPFRPAVPAAHSFAELLDPIPNAVERLKVADAQDAVGGPRLIKAQYYNHHHHHHHHHAYVVVPRYHPYYRRHVYRYGYRHYAPRVVVPYVVPYQQYHHHHHHHHHHHQQDGY